MNPAKKQVLKARLLCIPVMILLVLLELTPFPVAALFVLVVMIWRPRWFRAFVDQLYVTKE